MKIPLFDLKRQYFLLKEEIDKAIFDVLEKGRFVLGPEVEELENNFAAFCEVKHCIAVSSGTDALYLSLKALGIGHGDEVITTAYSFVGTILPIFRLGANPVLVDCEEKDFNIDVNKIESAITSRTKAIIPVHLFGQPADMEAITEVAGRHNLYVIEDACQAHGAEYKGKKVGGLGDLGCFSFYPTKNLGSFGDGGAVATDNANLAEKIKILRNCGQREKYNSVLKGDNCRLDSLQAAVLKVKLKYLNQWNSQRRENVALYNNLLAVNKSVIIPREREGDKHIYHLYIIRSENRRRIKEKLGKQGIESAVYYPIPLHLQAVSASLGYKKGDFPAAEKCSQTALALPIFPGIKKEEIEFVCQTINKK